MSALFAYLIKKPPLIRDPNNEDEPTRGIVAISSRATLNDAFYGIADLYRNPLTIWLMISIIPEGAAARFYHTNAINLEHLIEVKGDTSEFSEGLYTSMIILE